MDLFLYIKISWFLQTGALPGFGFSPRKNTCIKTYFEFNISPKEITQRPLKYFGEATHFLKLCSHQMMSPLQSFWPFFNTSFSVCNLEKIDTSICIANSCWQVITIKEEFLLRELLLEPAESTSLTWWRISLPNKLPGRIKILALCAQMEHLWCLATHLVLLLWWRNILLISTCSCVSQCQRLRQRSWKTCLYFYERCQPPESQGWHTSISRSFVKKWE